MESPATSPGPTPDLHRLLVRPGRDSLPHPGPERTVVPFVALRGPAGRFLVPTLSRRSAARSLLAYNRLRPRRVRATRALMAAGLGLGLGPLLGRSRVLTAGPDADVLLDLLANVLGERQVAFAGTDRACTEFVTPVLQLFTPAGKCVGFAKLGWDRVTRAMIDNEADALRRVGAAHTTHVHVPELAWHGRWHELSVLVTAPMPPRVTRRRAELPVPIEPLHEIACVDGRLDRTTVGRSAYLEAATTTAWASAGANRPALADRLATVEAACGDLVLDFGRWHGDFVEWNLGTDHGRLFAWDWAYSAPRVPLGFDAMHFSFLRHEVLGGISRAQASKLAAEEAAPALHALGLDDDAQRAVVMLHRLEVELRDTRAWLDRRPDGDHAIAEAGAS